MKPILEKLDPHEDVSDLESDVPITNIYFVAPPSEHIDEALLTELANMRGSVKAQFEELYV